MKEQDEDLLLKGAMIIGVVLVVKGVVGSLGSDADKQAVNDQQTMEPSVNAFSYQFTPYVQKYTPKYNGQSMQQYWQTIKSNYNGSNEINGTDQDIAVFAETLYNSIGFWQTIHESDIQAIFSAMSSQVDVAAVSAYLFSNYNLDLLSFLKSGLRYPILNISFLQYGLTDAMLATIIAQVQSLPQS